MITWWNSGVAYTKIASIVDNAGVVTCPAPWVYSAAADVSGVNGVTAAFNVEPYPWASDDFVTGAQHAMQV